MIYSTIEIFPTRLTGAWSLLGRNIVICWDNVSHPDVTQGFYLETLGM